jgi:hypothetical protein
VFDRGGGGGVEEFYLHIGDRIMVCLHGLENWRKARQTRFWVRELWGVPPKQFESRVMAKICLPNHSQKLFQNM